MSKDMCSGNRPKLNTGSGLTPNGGGAGGVPPGSAPERNALGSPRASRPALRGFFAPGTPAAAAASPGGSGGQAADVDELAATLGRPRRDAGGGARRGRGGRARRRPRDGGLQPARNRRQVSSGRWGPVARRTPNWPQGHSSQPRRRAGRTAGHAGPEARRAAGRRPGRRRPREPVHAAARRPVLRPAVRSCTVPAKPRWLLSIPDAISQLEKLDRTLLTRTSSASPRSAPPRS